MSEITRKMEAPVGRKIPADYPLFALMLIILALGLFMVFDASYAQASQSGITHHDPAYFFKLQSLWALIGMAALIFAMRMRYWKLARYGGHAMAFGILLLVLVMAPHLGVHSHGAARWLKLGPIRMQPSEIAKICVVLYLASFISRRQRSIQRLETGVVGALFPVLIAAALIIKQPDLGTALTLVATAMVMLAIGGAKLKHLAAISLLGFTLVAMMAWSHPYSRLRLQSFVSGSAGDRTYSYQANQSLKALESGGVHGIGPGEGDAKFFHLPAPYTDSIATTLGEEFGLIGSLVLIGLFFLFTLRGCHIAHQCRNAYGKLLASGLCAMITIQALLNLAVITRSVPETGVPLPMVSFGGSSLVLVMFAIGLILSVSRWPDLCSIEFSPADAGSSRTYVRRPLRMESTRRNGAL